MTLRHREFIGISSAQHSQPDLIAKNSNFSLLERDHGEEMTRENRDDKRKTERSYRFGSLLELGEHPFDVFEVGGERGVVEGEVPLPGGTALRINTETISDFNMTLHVSGNHYCRIQTMCCLCFTKPTTEH